MSREREASLGRVLKGKRYSVHESDKPKLIMKCGCAPDSVTHIVIDGERVAIDACVVHFDKVVGGVFYGYEVMDRQPDLTGRKARCASCDKVVDSEVGLAFFEYQGDTKTADQEVVAERNALLKEWWDKGYSGRKGPDAFPTMVSRRIDELNRMIKETATGDLYFCGCAGWD